MPKVITKSPAPPRAGFSDREELGRRGLRAVLLGAGLERRDSTSGRGKRAPVRRTRRRNSGDAG